jgi:hypothetical protein
MVRALIVAHEPRQARIAGQLNVRRTLRAEKDKQMADKERQKEFLGWISALQKAMDSSVAFEDPTNVWKYEGYQTFARKYNQIVEVIAKEEVLPPIIDIFDMDKIKGPGNTLAYQQKHVYMGVHSNLALLKAYIENKIGLSQDEYLAFRDFIQAKLRSAQLAMPESEKDIQNSLEQLFIGRGYQKGIDYDREVGRVKVSVKEVIPDFIFPKFELAIELKIIKEASRIKVTVDEINADITAYSKKYRRLLFVVYDMGFIRNEIEYKNGISKDGSIDVVIIKN